jgi:hypothetical protein
MYACDSAPLQLACAALALRGRTWCSGEWAGGGLPRQRRHRLHVVLRVVPACHNGFVDTAANSEAAACTSQQNQEAALRASAALKPTVTNMR